MLQRTSEEAGAQYLPAAKRFDSRMRPPVDDMVTVCEPRCQTRYVLHGGGAVFGPVHPHFLRIRLRIAADDSGRRIGRRLQLNAAVHYGNQNASPMAITSSKGTCPPGGVSDR